MNFKNIVSGFLFVVTIVSLNAQGYRNNNTSSTLKVGIYKNYEEFKNNAPSIQLNHQILNKQLNTGGIMQKQESTFYYLDIDKVTAKKIGKVYGFSDGKNVYINEFHPNLRSKTLFMRVDFIANYGVLEYITFNGNLDLLPTKNKVIDMESGKIKFMKRTELQKLVANHTTYITYANNRKTIPTLGK